MKGIMVVVLAALASCACGGSGLRSVVASSGTEQEAHVINETSRYAAFLHVDVRGELTDYKYVLTWTDSATGYTTTTYAAGWYDKGVAYYYRPYIVKQTDLRYISAIAAHEVCHAVSYMHGPKHDECTKKLAGV